MNAQSWLDTLISNHTQFSKRELLKVFADKVDLELKDKNFTWCNELCEIMASKVESLYPQHTSLILTMLIYTLGAKDRLSHRSNLWNALSNITQQDQSFNQEVASIIQGLK